MSLCLYLMKYSLVPHGHPLMSEIYENKKVLLLKGWCGEIYLLSHLSFCLTCKVPTRPTWFKKLGIYNLFDPPNNLPPWILIDSTWPTKLTSIHTLYLLQWNPNIHPIFVAYPHIWLHMLRDTNKIHMSTTNILINWLWNKKIKLYIWLAANLAMINILLWSCKGCAEEFHHFFTLINFYVWIFYEFIIYLVSWIR